MFNFQIIYVYSIYKAATYLNETLRRAAHIVTFTKFYVAQHFVAPANIISLY